MLAALAQTATDLGVGLLITCCLFGLAVLIGRCIHGAEAPEPAPPSEPKDAGDLDDWLAEVGPLEEFKLWERPKSQSELERRGV
jgi:hypothetical protein